MGGGGKLPHFLKKLKIQTCKIILWANPFQNAPKTCYSSYWLQNWKFYSRENLFSDSCAVVYPYIDPPGLCIKNIYKRSYNKTIDFI